MCVHPCVCMLLQSTNSCRDLDSRHLSSPLKSPWAFLSVPYQRMEGPRPHRDRHCRCQALLRLRGRCGDLCCAHGVGGSQAGQGAAKPEGHLRGRIPWSWEPGSWEWARRFHPGQEGGAEASWTDSDAGCWMLAAWTRARATLLLPHRCHGYRVAWKGEGPFLPSRSAEQVFSGLSVTGT